MKMIIALLVLSISAVACSAAVDDPQPSPEPEKTAAAGEAVIGMGGHGQHCRRIDPPCDPGLTCTAGYCR
jgi:hypothetical protein